MNVSIVPVSTGIPCPVYFHNNEHYVEVPPEGEYIVRLTNGMPVSRLAVLSVDGINAVDGKDASYDGDGWVVRAGQSIDVKGWFRSTFEVAAFTFSAAGKNESYAEKTGRGRDNVGVIGVAVFDERRHYRDLWNYAYSANVGGRPAGTAVRNPDGARGCTINTHDDGHSTTCATNASSEATMDSREIPTKTSGGLKAPSETLRGVLPDIGTAYGKRTVQHSVRVTFERASKKPSAILTLRYATREVLRSWGVPVDAPQVRRPVAFPLSEPGGVPAPAGWTGK